MQNAPSFHKIQLSYYSVGNIWIHYGYGYSVIGCSINPFEIFDSKSFWVLQNLRADEN